MTHLVNKGGMRVNDKFFALPEEKRQAIINAGYRVFAQNTYKKSPMSDVAEAAGISKALLFHYFVNKRELYLFLLKQCAEVTLEALNRFDCYGGTDLFEIMRRGLKVKAQLRRRYPDMSSFVIKAYYESDPAVAKDVQEFIKQHGSYHNNVAMARVDPAQFVEGLDLKMMYQDMFWASEGYIWEMTQREDMNLDRMEQDFDRLIDFWKQLYLRKEAKA